MDYGHHWHNCKNGRPEDIAAMKAIKRTPKKRGKKANSARSSILPLEEDAPTASMSFPPSQTLEITTHNKRKYVESTPEPSQSRSLEVSSKKKGQHTGSNSRASKRSRSGSNNQPAEPLSIDHPVHIEQPVKPKQRNKAKPTKKAANNPRVPLDSPSMCTRSKRPPASPAMSTRSKRRLSI